MQHPAERCRPSFGRRGAPLPARDDLWSILADAGLWIGVSVDAVIDRIETEPRTKR